MNAPEPKLTRRQALFVAAYLGQANGNATEAARIAGYRHPHVQGTQNLAVPSIRAAVERDRAAIRQQGIVVKQNRLDRLNARWEEIGRIVAERAADPLHQQFPGGETGLLAIEPQLVKVYKSVDPQDDDDEGETLYSDKSDRIVYVATLDTALIKEERELAKQAAIEMGEWNEKKGDQPSVNVNITNELKAAVLGYDDFAAEFARLTGLGSAGSNGAPQPLDSAEAHAAPSVLPRPAGS